MIWQFTCIRAKMHVDMTQLICRHTKIHVDRFGSSIVHVRKCMQTCKITFCQFVYTQKNTQTLQILILYILKNARLRFQRSFCIREKVFTYSFFRRLYNTKIRVQTCNFECRQIFTACIQTLVQFVYTQKYTSTFLTDVLYT